MTPGRQYEHLTDRELLLLTAQTVDGLQKAIEGPEGLAKRVSRLETWRTLLTGVWMVISAAGWCAWDYLINGNGIHGKH